MPRVLIADSLSPAAVDIFRQRGIDVDIKTGLSKDELIAVIGDYDGLVVRSDTKPNKDVIAAATKLKNRRRAGSSRVAISSGCHCTPATKRRPGSSAPSMQPSSAHAVATRPEPSWSIAWWCMLFTFVRSAPNNAARQLPGAICTP